MSKSLSKRLNKALARPNAKLSTADVGIVLRLAGIANRQVSQGSRGAPTVSYVFNGKNGFCEAQINSKTTEVELVLTSIGGVIATYNAVQEVRISDALREAVVFALANREKLDKIFGLITTLQEKVRAFNAKLEKA